MRIRAAEKKGIIFIVWIFRQPPANFFLYKPPPRNPPAGKGWTTGRW
jgi:hypothetical protein